MMSNRVTKLVLGSYLPPLRVISKSRMLIGPESCNLFNCRENAFIHTSSHSHPCYVGSNWRKSRGLSANPNAYGPLTDGPDYSFIDGRPTPPGSRKIIRAMEQKAVAEKIMKLQGEVDFAVAHHETRVKNQEAQRKQILDSKLKPKGKLPPEIFSR
ncbi:39S ribosomal protein L52, mitochondrial [Orchesella cincta]|uniref:Large ribosomal subunit protein mL52 n=1 Tax=Orchesella cincta TaxID=48709 RepID=A0A1D2MN12_ORCCI|nr:39S ribosomal protein L52, mitochondrial [Orchesella cincta]